MNEMNENKQFDYGKLAFVIIAITYFIYLFLHLHTGYVSDTKVYFDCPGVGTQEYADVAQGEGLYVGCIYSHSERDKRFAMWWE